MRTLAHVRFYDRIRYFEIDIELVTGVANVFENLADAPHQNMAAGLAASAGTYPLLERRRHTKNSRKIVTGHLRYTVYAAFIKEMYEEFTMYLRHIVTGAARAGLDPNRFAGQHQINVSAVELLALGSWEKVVSHVSDSLFRTIENERSTFNLIDQVNRKLGLRIAPGTRDAARPYLDLRHLLVHNDGRIDDIFRQTHQNFVVETNVKGRIRLHLGLLLQAKNAIGALVDEIDARVLETGLCPADEIQN